MGVGDRERGIEKRELGLGYFLPTGDAMGQILHGSATTTERLCSASSV